MNPFEMVVLLVGIGAVVSIVRAKYGVRENAWGNEHHPEDARENAQLREEVKQLKDRLHVLERIATDNNRAVDLDREIERLR